MDFYKALIKDGKCYGAVFFNEARMDLEIVYADDLVMATGGQNALFGKTTGSTLCDGYAQGRLFLQGVEKLNGALVVGCVIATEEDQVRPEIVDPGNQTAEVPV